MKRFAIIAALLCSAPALAQSPAPGPSIPVPLNDQERQVVLSMCAAATWAQRQQFDGVCEYLKNKFDAAVKAAEKPADPVPEKKE